MTEHHRADEARKGLMDSVKGRAKEIAGAVTGNDSLTAEGQLDQAQARQRKQANAADAVAEAAAAEAADQKTAAQIEGAHQRRESAAKAQVVEDAARAQQRV
ncbi:MAG: CsbD family protein, partial [Mycobacterium sp.]